MKILHFNAVKNKYFYAIRVLYSLKSWIRMIPILVEVLLQVFIASVFFIIFNLTDYIWCSIKNMNVTWEVNWLTEGPFNLGFSLNARENC